MTWTEQITKTPWVTTAPLRKRVLVWVERLAWLVGIGIILGFLYLPIAVLVAYSFMRLGL